MDDARFDEISRRVASRRTVVGGLTAALAALAAPLIPEGLARKKKKKKPKKCKAGAVRCGKTCVNTGTDAQNCGGCGNRCANGAACLGGQCKPPTTTQCPAGQFRCGGQCVDPSSDESHCGSCGNRCQGDLTCLDGLCGCADGSDTQCGSLCVDTQTDEENCGSCGNTCGDNETCRQGGCTSSPCGPNEIDCGGGRCIPDVPNACCGQSECGDYSMGDFRLNCQNDVCVCQNPDEGLCRRLGTGGICSKCCEGGSGVCPGDKGCYEGSLESGCTCDASGGGGICETNPPQRCSRDYSTDPRRCGRDCIDCTLFEGQQGAICCGGLCNRGCQPGEVCPPQKVCDPDCQPCASGFICCNQGPDTPPSCIRDIGNNGVCYRVP